MKLTRTALIVLLLGGSVIAVGFVAVMKQHGTSARAATFHVSGVSSSQLAAVGITVNSTSQTSEVTKDEAEATAGKAAPFNGQVVDAELASCQMASDAPTVLCWVVTFDPSGDEIVPDGPGAPEGTTLPDRPAVQPAFEAAFVDGNSGAFISAVQSSIQVASDN